MILKVSRVALIVSVIGIVSSSLIGQIRPPVEKKKNTSQEKKEAVAPSVKSVTNETDTVLPYPFQNGDSGTLYLNNPVGVQAHYDLKTKQYVITHIAGGYQLNHPIYLTREQYADFLRKQYSLKYMVSKSRELDEINRQAKKGKRGKRSGNILPSFTINSKLFETIFGGNTIQLIPNGYITLELAGLIQKIENPELSAHSRTNFTPDFDQRIQLGLTGKIGENVTLTANYDTKFTFGFENKLNFGYTGKEDEIVKSLEVGNISMPLRNSLVAGPQSLFGVKTELQFGRMFITGVFSQQQSEAKTLEIQNGGIVNEFEIYALDYEENSHYFLSQYFRENYDRWLARYPFITSGINITRIEVWALNTNSTETVNNRNLVAFADLGEQSILSNSILVESRDQTLPSFDVQNTAKNSNNLFQIVNRNNQVRNVTQAYTRLQSLNFRPNLDFFVLENARLLNQSEYQIKRDLGYISLNQPLAEDQVLAVAFEYTLGGQVYQVGEFSNQISTSNATTEQPNNSQNNNRQENLIVKMLKSTQLNVREPIWDLMMKNIYSLNAFGISSEEFQFNILYKDERDGQRPLNYLLNSTDPSTDVSPPTLLSLLNMDRLRLNGDPVLGKTETGEIREANIGDGLFDFEPGITIDPQNGRIIFTSVEPFGGFLRRRLNEMRAPSESINLYVFEELYTTTKIEAEARASRKNKFIFKGFYKASEGGGGISIGSVNVPEGSVKVTSGGKELIENVDYIVDYQLGKIEIINDAIASSGIPIQVSVEDNSALDLQTKRFIGLNVEHRFSEDFIVGATYLNYKERPITQKVSYGAEPVNNSIFGANIEFSKEIPFLTQMVNKLPFINTKAPSSISVGADFAYLKPDSSNGIDIEGEATSFIDDFEDTQTEISILDANEWVLASTPGGGAEQEDFVNGNSNELDYGFDRAKLAWYTIDQLFYGLGRGRPAHISADDLSQNDVRQISIRELFPNQDVVTGTVDVLSTLDLTYFPTERGPYNFDPNNANGIANPEDAWAGIMKPIFTSNFEKSNVEFIEFWLLDPFSDTNTNQGGDLYFHLGNVSEDILRDGRKQYENGLPVNNNPNAPTAETIWGQVPEAQSVVYAFSTKGADRTQQDIGLDGLNDTGESSQFELNGVDFGNDPSEDNFLYFLDASYDAIQAPITERYRDFNGTEGNSGGINSSATASPDIEDLNKDQTLNRTESYYQYKVSIRPDDLEIGRNFVTDIRESVVSLENGSTTNARWYQFKIPIFEGQSIGGISGFRSIRFIRMALSDFEEKTTLRFGTLDLVRTEWRRFIQRLAIDENGKDDITANDPDLQSFEISDINLIENSNRSPIPYVLPPGIDREELFNQTEVQSQNEGSMVLRIQDLEKNDARAAYRSGNFDLRRYKRLRMFIHAEKLNLTDNLEDRNVSAFLRIGNDLTDNYYEYEIPLSITLPNSNTPDAIWPEQNRLDIALEELVNTKLARDIARVEIGERYRQMNEETGHTIWIKGRPSLSNIRVLMLGVRNNENTNKSAEVWFNELRITEFETEGAWAASARVDVQLADFATVSISGSKSTTGFGGIDQMLIERSQEDQTEYIINTQTNLGMLTPKNWGLKLPLNYSFSEQFINPEYNPLDEDVEISQLEGRIKDSILDISRDYTQRVSLSLLNFGKERTTEKSKRFFDVENLSLSYIYNQTYHRDINTNYQISKDLRASVDYNYQFEPLEWQLFKDRDTENDTTFIKKIWSGLKALELNINPLPSRLSFRTEINRKYNEQLFRDIQSPNSDENVIGQLPIFGYNFGLNYEYNIGFDLTRSFTLDYTSSINRLVEDIGIFEETRLEQNLFIEQPDQNLIYENFFNFGRPIKYHQTARATYKLPTQIIPYLDWMEVEASYNADYDWKARSRAFTSLNADDNLGNIIQNQLSFQSNANLDFESLYDYFPYMKIYQQKIENWGSGKKSKGKIKDEDGKSYSKRMTLKDYGFMLLTSIKSGEVSYSRNNGSVLPGFRDEANFFGRGETGPSIGFLFGDQVNVLQRGLLEGWNFVESKNLNEPYQRTHTENIDYQLSMGVIPDFSIELVGGRVYSESRNIYNFTDPAITNPLDQISGNFNITAFTFGTSFKDADRVFENFRNNRLAIARRLAATDSRSASVRDDGFPEGYSGTNQNVVIPAFLSAYSGKTGSETKLSPFRNIPLPNWTVTYNGLLKLKWFKKRFEALDIRHAYRSAYSVNNFESNLKYQEAQRTDDNADDFDTDGNFLNSQTISGVNIVESFEPLVGIDFSLKNGVQASFDYKKERTLSLSLHNNAITEVLGEEIVLGLGYLIKDVQFNMRIAGKKRKVKSDLNLKADLSIRNTETTIRKFVDGDNQITGGQDLISIKAQADYNFSKKFNLRLFYDQNITKYAISTSFPISNIRFGLSARLAFN